MENNEKYPLGKLILVAVIGFISAFLFFSIRGFAYDLELGNYDFNGFDDNADFIFDDFIENDMDVYNNTEYENLNLLIQKLKDNGYTDEYIQQYRIKVQTTVNENFESRSSVHERSEGADLPDREIELTEENGATDAIVSDLFMENETTENTYTINDIYDLLSNIDTSIYNLNSNITDLSADVSALKDSSDIVNESPLTKEIENFNTVEVIGLIILFAILGGTVVFFCIKFTPHYGRL